MDHEFEETHKYIYKQSIQEVLKNKSKKIILKIDPTPLLRRKYYRFKITTKSKSVNNFSVKCYVSINSFIGLTFKHLT